MTFSPITLGSGLAGYNYLARTRGSQQAIFDRSPVIARDVAAVREKLASVQTSQQLMEDRTLLRVALGAFGLDQGIDNRAFIQKILDSDLSDRTSLANKLADKRYLAFAQAFNFKGEEGPKLPNAHTADELTQKLQQLSGPDDLLRDSSLPRSALDQFGLQEYERNPNYLKLVLESDMRDPASFANRSGDARLIEFAQTFDFFRKDEARAGTATLIERLQSVFAGRLQDLKSADDLLDAPDLLSEALAIFGLDDVYTVNFMRDVLTSDLGDALSVANRQSDPRFATFAAAFNFGTPKRDEMGVPVLDKAGQPLFLEGTLQAFLTVSEGVTGSFARSDDFLQNRPLRDASFALLGIEQTFSSRRLAQRVLESDLTDPRSFANLFADPRYAALSNLVRMDPPQSARMYPEGFVDQVVRNYLDRQFEIQVGEADPDMRIALSLERELDQVLRTSSSNEAQWYSVMSSPPLRKVFEGAFRLPSSFGSIDIDQQLMVLRERAERFFGFGDVKEFREPENLEKLRRDYLIFANQPQVQSSSSAGIAALILSNF